MTAVFIVCLAISAICQTAEFGWLNREYEGFTRLRISYIMKFCIVIAAIGTAIAMVISPANRRLKEGCFNGYAS
jgi:Frag1/DRAM/Sfk1 family